jgi:hypothetical protein
VEIFNAEPVEEGIVRGTLIPFPEPNAGGIILRLPEYFSNTDTGYTRLHWEARDVSSHQT